MSWLVFGDVNNTKENIKKKTLIIELMGGKDIVAPVDSDIFCVCCCGKQQFKSEIVRNTANIIWQQIFQFDYDSLPNTAIIEISCYVSGFLSNTLIGDVRIPFIEHKDIAVNFSMCHWFSLYNPTISKNKGSIGEIGVKIGIDGFESEKEIDDESDNQTVEEIYKIANIYATDANNSAKRSLQLVEQTKEINAQTLITLKDQEAQMEKMQLDMETIHNNMRQSERKIRSIESVWGSLANKITSSNNTKHKRKANLDRKLAKKRQKNDEKIQELKEMRWKESRENDKLHNQRKPMVKYGKNVIGQNEENTFYEIYDETEHIAEKISNGLDDLKDISTNINVQLIIDRERVDALKYDVDRAIPRMDNATRKARSLIKKN
jgi:hypothetical protein